MTNIDSILRVQASIRSMYNWTWTSVHLDLFLLFRWGSCRVHPTGAAWSNRLYESICVRNSKLLLKTIIP